MRPMTSNREASGRTRQNLRLDPDTWAAIDAARGRRSGKIARNTWIAEAIAEKLQRERQLEETPRSSGSGRA